MIRLNQCFVMVSLLSPAVVHGGEVEDQCIARAIADHDKCACLQASADATVRPGLHDLIADHLGERVDVAVIAATRGHSGAEALYDANEAFNSDVEERCAIVLRE